jgi:hypothetical protein
MVMGARRPSEFPRLRSKRYATWAIRDLRLEGRDKADYVRGVTTAFRSSEEPPWPRVREFVRDKGIDPSAGVLADFFLDRYGSFLGVIVSADGRAFGFCLLYFGDPEHPSPWDQIKLFDWRELSKPEARKPHEDQLRIGMELLSDSWRRRRCLKSSRAPYRDWSASWCGRELRSSRSRFRGSMKLRSRGSFRAWG